MMIFTLLEGIQSVYSITNDHLIVIGYLVEDKGLFKLLPKTVNCISSEELMEIVGKIDRLNKETCWS